MPKHTPGPWCVNPSPPRMRTGDPRHLRWHEQWIHVGEPSNFGNAFVIVSLGGPGATSGGAAAVQANAHLIAAAPDLLAACKALLPRRWRDGTMDHMPGVKIAREAIAKAEGSSEPQKAQRSGPGDS